LSSQTKIHDTAPTAVDGIEIEDLNGTAKVREVERLQTESWRANEAWIVPSHVLLIVSEYGGILLGARVDGELAGFVLGFLAQTDGHLFHASHMLGVHPAAQHQGIGAALKCRQREVARGQGLDLMSWTFDPLEARNAHFNFHKLGTVCRTYRPDYYGPMPDALNRDLPSDRLLVEWHLGESPAAQAVGDIPRPILRNREGLPQFDGRALEDGLPIGIQIPPHLQQLKRDAPDVALAWRLAVRQAFSAAFAQGYLACDFREGAYVLVPAQEADS
jgi:chorismate synthase